MRPIDQTTWIAMLHEPHATVYESTAPGSVLTRVRYFAAKTGDSLSLRAEVARQLDVAAKQESFQRLILVGAPDELAALSSLLEPCSGSRLAQTYADDLSAVEPDALRAHVPELGAVPL